MSTVQRGSDVYFLSLSDLEALSPSRRRWKYSSAFSKKKNHHFLPGRYESMWKMLTSIHAESRASTDLWQFTPYVVKSDSILQFSLILQQLVPQFLQGKSDCRRVMLDQRYSEKILNRIDAAKVHASG